MFRSMTVNHSIWRTLCLAGLLFNATACQNSADPAVRLSPVSEPLPVARVPATLLTDEGPEQSFWDEQPWLPIDQLWLGEPPADHDFSGAYRLGWTEQALHLRLRIVDDVLHDAHADPLKRWWDDDCVEIFIDADASGGLHQFTHNAFAYHVSLSGDVVDLDLNEQPVLLNDHIQTRRDSRELDNGTVSIWDIRIRVFDDRFTTTSNQPAMLLNAGDRIGFAVAYCDNDGGERREHFVGSTPIEGPDRNIAWINASVFSTLILRP